MAIQVHIERKRQLGLSLNTRSSIAIGLVMLFSSNIVLACTELSGSNATANNQRLVVIYAVAAIGALLSTLTLYFVRRRKGLPAILFSLVFLSFHPLWYFGGGGGDCGMWFAQLDQLANEGSGLTSLKFGECQQSQA
jgi:cell division protein FtsW (lipid II flippase)